MREVRTQNIRNREGQILSHRARAAAFTIQQNLMGPEWVLIHVTGDRGAGLHA